MARSTGGGVAVVGAVAVMYGLFVAFGGFVGLLASGSALGLLVSLVQLLFGAMLIPAGIGIIKGIGLARLLGIVGFLGIPVVQLLPMAAGSARSAPFLGMIVAVACGLYLALAGEAFQGGGERPVPDDVEEEETTSNPLR